MLNVLQQFHRDDLGRSLRGRRSGFSLGRRDIRMLLVA